MKTPKEKICDICGNSCKSQNYCDNEYAIFIKIRICKNVIKKLTK